MSAKQRSESMVSNNSLVLINEAADLTAKADATPYSGWRAIGNFHLIYRRHAGTVKRAMSEQTWESALALLDLEECDYKEISNQLGPEEADAIERLAHLVDRLLDRRVTCEAVLEAMNESEAMSESDEDK